MFQASGIRHQASGLPNKPKYTQQWIRLYHVVLEPQLLLFYSASRELISAIVVFIQFSAFWLISVALRPFASMGGPITT